MSTEPASPGTVPAGTDAPVEQAAAGEPNAPSELEGTAPPAGGTVPPAHAPPANAAENDTEAPAQGSEQASQPSMVAESSAPAPDTAGASTTEVLDEEDEMPPSLRSDYVPKAPTPTVARDFMRMFAGKNLRRVTYFYHEEIGNLPSVSPVVPKNFRHKLTWHLLKAYNLTDTPLLQVRTPKPLPLQLMTRFHSDDYINTVATLSRRPHLRPGQYADQKLRYKLTGVNTVRQGTMEQSQVIAGASIEAAQLLTKGRTDVAINFMGGYQHARMDEASGGCFVNDSVLACLELLTKFDRVLYVNMGYFHSDAVEEAFYMSNRVFTLSFNPVPDENICKFPGTGKSRDSGHSTGKRFNFNVPFERGCGDNTYTKVFQFTIRHVVQKYNPQVIVCSAGTGILGGTRAGYFNVSSEGYARCMRFLRDFRTPLLLLGGTSGSCLSDTAKAWAVSTAQFLCAEDKLPPRIPENPYSDLFFPQDTIHTDKRLVEDENSKSYIDETLEHLMDTLSMIRIPGAIRRKQLQQSARGNVSKIYSPNLVDDDKNTSRPEKKQKLN